MAVIANLWTSPAGACSCVGSAVGSHPCVALWQADAVFAGRAAAVEVLGGPEPEGDYACSSRRVSFEVAEGFRGAETGDVVEIVTGMGGGDCGYDFELGKSYVVYAHRGDAGVLYAGICGRTRTLSEAEEDLRYGRRIAAGEQPSLVYGIALHRTRRSADEYGEQTPIAGSTIRVQGPDRRSIESTTDGEGRFQVELPGGGDETSAADWSAVAPEPAAPIPPAAEQAFSVADGSCAAVEIGVDDLARITGTLIDATGQPPDWHWLELVEAAAYRSPEGGRTGHRAGEPAAVGEPSAYDEARVDDHGSFTFVQIYPGEYLLVVNRSQFPSPYPRIFYPGTTDLAQALPVAVAAGEVVDVGTFNLPSPRRQVEIRGTIRHANGEAAAGVELQADHDVSGDSYSTSSDEQGRFTFTVYEGFEFRVWARESSRSLNPIETVEAVEVVPTRDGGDVELILKDAPQP